MKKTQYRIIIKSHVLADDSIEADVVVDQAVAGEVLHILGNYHRCIESPDIKYNPAPTGR